MSTFGIEPPSDWLEFDAAAITSGIDLETAGAGQLDVMSSGAGVTVRSLTVADDEEILGFFTSVRGTSTATRIRVGW